MSPSVASQFDEIGQAPKLGRSLVQERLVLGYFLASLAFMLLAMFAGFLYSLQFLQAFPFAGVAFLSPGRWRMVHTNAVVFGFLTNAFLGAAHWAIPRLTLRPVLSDRLSWFVFIGWQGVVLAALVGLLAGQAQAALWGESPRWVVPFAQIGLLLVATNFLYPILKVSEPMYASLWFFIAGLVWAVLAFAMAGASSQYPISGTALRADVGLFIHDRLGLFLTPFGLGLMYYFVPVMLRKPIWCHGLALFGFWLLAIAYPLAAIDRLLEGAGPMLDHHTANIAAIIPGVIVEIAVGAAIINFFATMRGEGRRLRTVPSIRWFYLGAVFYSVAWLQSACEMALGWREYVQYSDWAVSHSHLVMFGVFGFWVLGIMHHLIPRLLGANGWYRPGWNAWHFGLTGVGMMVMFLDLMIAGLVQGAVWANLEPWEVSILASVPFWITRTVSGSVIIVGQMFFVYNIIMTAVQRYIMEPSTTAAPSATGSARR